MAKEIIELFDGSHIFAGIVGGLAVALAEHFLRQDRERVARGELFRHKLISTIRCLLLDMQREGDLVGFRYERKPELSRAISDFITLHPKAVELQTYLKKYQEIPPSALSTKIETAPDGSSVIGRSQAVATLSQPLNEMLDYVDAA
jgi:hypothetical protein